jgi:uncharacterized protein YndB with AHSA1/START domain
MESVVEEIVLPISAARAWQLITEPKHLRIWYAFDGAAVDLRVGGRVEHFWKEHGRFCGRIEEIAAPYRLAYRYSTRPDAEPAAGYQTHVLFELFAQPGGTLMRVTESGFDQLEMTPDERELHARMTRQGWSGGLAALAELARS